MFDRFFSRLTLPGRMLGPGDFQQELAAARSPSEEALAAELAQALGGFSVDEADLQPLPGGSVMATASAANAARQREVASGAAVLVELARGGVAGVVESCSTPGASLHQECDALARMCFALRSAIGCAGLLSDADAEALFDLAATLWVSWFAGLFGLQALRNACIHSLPG